MWEVNLRVTEEFQTYTDGQEDYLSIPVCVDDAEQKGADGLGPEGCVFSSEEAERRNTGVKSELLIPIISSCHTHATLITTSWTEREWTELSCTEDV